MQLHRFFVPGPLSIGDLVFIENPLAHQLGRVLRLAVGQQITLLDNSGCEYICRIESIGKEEVSCIPVSSQPCSTEPKAQIWLYQAMLKPANFDIVLQKCTELGVTRFVPVASERSLSGRERLSDAKSQRWQAIIREAAEQSGRCRLPVIEEPCEVAAALTDVRGNGLSIFPWEKAGASSVKNILKSNTGPAERVNIFVGPEGGFTPDEAKLAEEHGCRIVSLGERILRAETAAIVSVALVLYELGELEKH